MHTKDPLLHGQKNGVDWENFHEFMVEVMPLSVCVPASSIPIEAGDGFWVRKVYPRSVRCVRCCLYLRMVDGL